MFDFFADVDCPFCVEQHEFQCSPKPVVSKKNMAIVSEILPKPSLHKVSRGCISNASCDGKTRLHGRGGARCEGIESTNRASFHRYSIRHDFGEGAEPSQGVGVACYRSCGRSLFQRSSLTDNLCLPFARRRLRTLRPFFVAILARKPCLLTLFRVWG